MQKILILFSDTGGGHRAAAEAIRDALKEKYGDAYKVVLEDGILHGALPPFHLIPKLYLPATTYTPWGWGLLFGLTNSRLGGRALNVVARLLSSVRMARLIRKAAPDLIVTVHPLLTLTPFRISKKIKPGAPFVTVVTDLFDAHVSWFSAPSDLVIVPTEGAWQRGIKWGSAPDRLVVMGLPVRMELTYAHQRQPNGLRMHQRELREQLGLEPDLFTILIVGGGEGMGRIEEIATALSYSGLPIQLAIVAGRNRSLQRRLETREWAVPLKVSGFVRNMHEWMLASDLVVTKAGPATIMETLAAERPLILSGYLPGQERGNVTFVLETGVGLFCERPEAIVRQVRDWLTPGNNSLQEMKARASAQVKPDAAIQIADKLHQLLVR